MPPKRPRVPRRFVTDDNPVRAFHAIKGTAQALADHEPVGASNPVKGTADSLLAPPLQSVNAPQAVNGKAEALLTTSLSANPKLMCEGTSQKGGITSPYAHAGLAAGEASSGTLGKEKVDILLGFITFREHVRRTQKPLRGLR